MSTILTDATRHVNALSTPSVAGPIQTSVQVVGSAPVVEAVTGNADSWKLLHDRLDALMKLGDTIARVCQILKISGTSLFLPPHILSDPPLRHFSLGSHLGCVQGVF